MDARNDLLQYAYIKQGLAYAKEQVDRGEWSKDAAYDWIMQMVGYSNDVFEEKNHDSLPPAL